MYSLWDPSIHKSGGAKIFIKNLDKAIDNNTLHDTFSSFGCILSCKIATDPFGESIGYGYVQFDNEESAQNAIVKLNGKLMKDKRVYVAHFIHKQARENEMSTRFNNVYVKNLAESTTKEDLNIIFGKYGTITSVVVMRDGHGKSKCFGFVNFESADEAAKAVAVLNGKKFSDKEWYVGKAHKKSERDLELKSCFEQRTMEAVVKFQGVNLYISNLDDSIDDKKLKELFSEFGTIVSCKVMRFSTGFSKGFGFIAFTTPEAASRALEIMNGKMVVSKPLYVAFAQRKEEKRTSRQMLPRRRVYRYPPVWNGSGGAMGGIAGAILPVPTGLQQPIPITAAMLASVLPHATPEEQRMMLGESLYPLVDELEHEHATKVTGMLLEMEATEVLLLIDSADALKAKVAEAMEVLRNFRLSSGLKDC